MAGTGIDVVLIEGRRALKAAFRRPDPGTWLNTGLS